MILYDENGMELNSYNIWDNVWTNVCCVLSIDVDVIIEIFELHWWSKSETKISGGVNIFNFLF